MVTMKFEVVDEEGVVVATGFDYEDDAYRLKAEMTQAKFGGG